MVAFVGFLLGKPLRRDPGVLGAFKESSPTHKAERCSVRELRGQTYRLQEKLTPGEFLVALIQLRAASEFYECLMPFSNFSAGKTKEKLLLRQKLCNGKEVNSKEIKGLSAAENQAQKDFGEFFADLFMCLKVAELAAQKDKQVKERLKRFYQQSASMRESDIANRTLRSYQGVKVARLSLLRHAMAETPAQQGFQK